MPTADLLRQALDVCWPNTAETSQISELTAEIREAAPKSGQPIFSSRLSIYVVDLSLVEQALLSQSEPVGIHGLLCSEYALDFQLQLMDARREVAGVGPDYSDPGRDTREFEVDPGALAEAEHQMADAAALQSGTFDVDGMREASAAQGRRVLENVRKLINGP
jgi:hypothetical protein